MKKAWKKLERWLSGVSREKQIVLCLVLTALCACLAWSCLGYPLPTAELEFRRMERTHLLPRSEIVFFNGERNKDGLRVSKQDGSVFALDGTELHLRGRWIVGVREDWASAACLDEGEIYSVPLGGGPALVPFVRWGMYLDHTGYWVTHGPGETPEGDPAYVYEYHNFLPFLLMNTPEETASVEIAVRLEEEERSGGGWQLADGIWMLGIEGEGLIGGEWTPGLSYTLRLYRADGSLLLERSGTLGEQ